MLFLFSTPASECDLHYPVPFLCKPDGWSMVEHAANRRLINRFPLIQSPESGGVLEHLSLDGGVRGAAGVDAPVDPVARDLLPAAMMSA